MKRIGLLGLLLVFTVTMYAHREDSYYLQGSFGNENVALQIDEFGRSCIANYFNEKDKIDHFFEGKLGADSTFYLKSYRWNQQMTIRTVSEEIILKEIALNVWEGTFINKNGEKLPVALQPIRIDTLNHPFKELIQEKDINPYRVFRTKDIRIKHKRKEKIADQLTVIHFIEKEYGLKWFQIENKTQKISLKEINIYLDHELFLMINQKFSCNNNNRIGNYFIDYNIQFINSELVSYSKEVISDCNGNSDQRYESFNTLDLKTAKPIMLEDLIWLSKTPYQELSRGEYNWYQYRYNSFGKLLFELIQNNSSKETKLMLEQCNLNKAKQWQLPNWYLTFQGIVFKPKENQAKCTPEILIKYRELNEFMITKYPSFKSYSK